MSYIQVELDAFNAFPLVARATGLSVEVVSHGLLSVWAHCYRAKVDRLRLVELRGFFGPCPDLVEWMMGFPPGWTSMVPRRARLRLLGNSVQPQTAMAAWDGLMVRLGVAA